jgi:hypothetical protein
MMELLCNVVGPKSHCIGRPTLLQTEMNRDEEAKVTAAFDFIAWLI